MRDDAHGIPSDVTHDHTGVRRVRHCYGRQRVDGCIIFGGDRVTTVGDDYSVDPVALRHNAEHVYEFVPKLRSHGLHGEWAGLMPFSKDGRPLVGELAPLGLQDLWVACGFGSNGVMSGPHAGRLVGEASVASLGLGSGRATSPAHARIENKSAPTAAVALGEGGSEAREGIFPERLAQAVAPCRKDGVQRQADARV